MEPWRSFGASGGGGKGWREIRLELLGGRSGGMWPLWGTVLPLCALNSTNAPSALWGAGTDASQGNKGSGISSLALHPPALYSLSRFLPRLPPPD